MAIRNNVANRMTAFLLCFLLIFIFCIAQPVYEASAIAFTLPVIAGAVICGTALVAAGLVFASTQDYDLAVEQFMSTLDENSRTALDVALGAATNLTYLPAKQTYQVMANCPDEVWTSAREWVIENFEVGENTYAISDSYFDGVPQVGIYTGTGDYTVHYVCNSAFSVSGLKYYPGDYWTYYWDFESKTILLNSWSAEKGLSSSVYVPDSKVVEVYVNSVNFWELKDVNGNSVTNYSMSYLHSCDVYANYILGESVDAYGDEQVGIGVDDWSWENTHTGERSVSVPIAKSVEKSLPVVDDAGVLVLDNAAVYDRVIDRDYSDVIAQEVGITVPAEIANTDAAAIANSLAPGINSVNKGVNDLLPALQAFALNLLSLYMWVPEETRAYIGVALSISLLAVVYKLIRG